MSDDTPTPARGALPKQEHEPPAESSTDPQAELQTEPPTEPPTDPWQDLRQWTPARIGLGRVGASLPTGELLRLGLAHARARDAVHAVLALPPLQAALHAAGHRTLRVQSQATSRADYLRRPDLGRSLDEPSRRLLASDACAAEGDLPRLTILIADGLSAQAAATHAVPLLAHLAPLLHGWQLDAVLLATGARVALGDEAGALRHAHATLMLLGERPGMSATDSLGAYLTWAPRPGRTDAERNCLSNIRGAAGMGYAEAAFRAEYLLRHARLAGASGLALKDGSHWTPPPPPARTLA